MIEYIVYLTTNSNISNSKCHILIDYTSHESFINLDQRKNGYGWLYAVHSIFCPKCKKS